MPDINKINGLVLCDEIHVNGVTIANILNIDSITKNCCTANGPISIAGPEDSCALACADEDCGNFYTDGTSGTCPLVNGDILYSDASCTLATSGYYSPTNCVGSCDYCYSVNGSGVITVTECPSTCNEILLSRSTESCTVACGGECTTYYTNASGVPTAGDYIYQTSECSCEGEQPAFTYYSNKCGERSGTCFTVNGSCQIGPIAGCGR